MAADAETQQHALGRIEREVQPDGQREAAGPQPHNTEQQRCRSRIHQPLRRRRCRSNRGFGMAGHRGAIDGANAAKCGDAHACDRRSHVTMTNGERNDGCVPDRGCRLERL